MSSKLLRFSLIFSFFLIFSSKNVYANNYINHIILTGQSLANGDFGVPALTRSQPYNNVRLDGNKFIPLVESGQESISSSMANFITSKSINNEYQVEMNPFGVGGAWFNLLKKGTSPFQLHINQIYISKALAEQQGKDLKVTAVAFLHGEADDMFGYDKFYEENLVELQHDYEAEANQITNQTEIVPLFTYQLSSYSQWRDKPEVSLAQLSAAENNPGKIILVTPMYFLTYTNGPHLTNYSYRLLGAYFGKVYKKVVIDKKEWKPLSPKTIVREGNIITATFNVPNPPLVFDTHLVLRKENYGFEFYQEGGNNPKIKSVDIIGMSKIIITLSDIPTGKNQRLRYAYTAQQGSEPGALEPGSSRGNLRDSDFSESLNGDHLYNWCVHFDEQILQNKTTQEKISSLRLLSQLIQYPKVYPFTYL